MMKELFLLKLGEIVLKGQNRRVFEDKLKTNTRRRMSKFGQFRVTITQSTLYVEPLNDECDVDGAWEACGAIFGSNSRRQASKRKMLRISAQSSTRSTPEFSRIKKRSIEYV